MLILEDVGLVVRAQESIFASTAFTSALPVFAEESVTIRQHQFVQNDPNDFSIGSTSFSLDACFAGRRLEARNMIAAVANQR